jgi:VWFA-related protein
MKTRIRSSAVCTLVIGAALVALGFAANAQKPPSESQQNPLPAQNGDDVIELHPQLPRHPPGVVGLIQIDLIQIDAVVTSKDGGFEDGLGPQNFILQEDGKPQKIDRVDHFDTRGTESLRRSNAPIVIALKSDIDWEKVLPIALNHRVIVLYFDLTTLSRKELKRSVDAALKFVREDATAADLIAVVSFGDQVRTKAHLTNDRETLERALTNLDPTINHDLQPLGGSASGVAGGGEDETTSSIFHMNMEIDALTALARILGGIPGRKSVI